MYMYMIPFIVSEGGGYTMYMKQIYVYMYTVHILGR